MNQHVDEFIAVSPPIDAARSAMPEGIQPTWDVAQIATRGHVLTARVAKLSRVLFLPALALGLVAGYGVFKASAVPSRTAPPSWVSEAFTFDPNTYFDLGGGLRGPVELAWMADYKPTPEGLSVNGLNKLAEAVRADTSAHGANVAEWTALASLEIAPKITSPARLLSEFSDRLKTGSVVVDGDRELLSTVSYVGGQWSIVMFRGGQCAALLGPVPSGCEDYTSKDGWTRDAINAVASLKPAGKE